MSSTTAVNCWCRPFTVEGRRKQSISSMLFSFGTNVCASVLFIASDTYVIRHTAKALCTRNWQNPNTAKTGEARDSRVFFEGYDLNAMSVADSQARSFSWTIVPLSPPCLFRKDTTPSCTRVGCLAKETPLRINVSGHTEYLRATHGEIFLGTQSIFVEGNTKG